MENELPKRKNTRLKDFDYGNSGAYFITICTRDRMCVLSQIVKTNDEITISERNIFENNRPTDNSVGEGLAPPACSEFKTHFKPCGEIVKEQLSLIETRFKTVTVEDYVIMPDHIHAIIFLQRDEKTGGASPSPTLNDVVCAFKSFTSRICKQRFGIEQIFQRSYADHIIRDREDYETRRRYIYENSMRWYYKYLSE